MPGQHAPRQKFDALFADPRHYRGDCRLLRTAVRNGWLDDAPQVDRDALMARFMQAMDERHAADPDTRNARAALAEARVLLEMSGQDLDNEIRAHQYCWGREQTGQVTGRPRERWHVSDYPNRIDAHEIRQQAKRDGLELPELDSISVGPTDQPAAAGERIAVSVAADARYGSRVWLVCPRCRQRRRYLYPRRGGVMCRPCAGITYRD